MDFQGLFSFQQGSKYFSWVTSVSKAVLILNLSRNVKVKSVVYAVCVCGLEVFKIPSCGRPHVINKVIFSPRVKHQTKQNQSTVHLGGTHFQSAQIIYIVTTIYSLIMFNQYD